MEFGSETRVTVKADYRDIVQALAKEAARELKKRGYEVSGHRVNAEILEEADELKMMLSFVVREDLDSCKSDDPAAPAKEAQGVEEMEPSQFSNVVDLGTGIYKIPMEQTEQAEESEG